jgi:hypothetical protein
VAPRPLVIFGRDEQVVYLTGFETGERQIEVRLVQFLQFEGEQFAVKVLPRGRAINKQPERPDLRIAPLITEDDWNLRDARRAALIRKWPSTTSPSLRASTGILNPNSLIEEHIRSTTASFLRDFARKA